MKEIGIIFTRHSTTLNRLLCRATDQNKSGKKEGNKERWWIPSNRAEIYFFGHFCLADGRAQHRQTVHRNGRKKRRQELMFSRHSFKNKNQTKKIAKNSWPARDFAIGSLSLALFSLEIGIEKCLFPFSIPFGGVLERSSVVWLERPRVIYNPRRTLSTGWICCDVVLFDNESREKKKKKMVCGPVIDRYRCCGPTRVALFWDASISIETRRHLRVTLTRRRFFLPSSI